MTLLVVIILIAVLIVVGLYVIKNAAKRTFAKKVPPQPPVHLNQPASPNVSSGSISDKTGTHDDGHSALNSGQQG